MMSLRLLAMAFWTNEEIHTHTHYPPPPFETGLALNIQLSKIMQFFKKKKKIVN